MALTDTAPNLYGAKQFGDLSLVECVMADGSGDAARIAAESSPDVTVDSGNHAGGVYIVSFPAGVTHFVLGFDVLGSTRTCTASLITTSAGVASITLTLSTAAALAAGTERLHFAVLVGRP